MSLFSMIRGLLGAGPTQPASVPRDAASNADVRSTAIAASAEYYEAVRSSPDRTEIPSYHSTFARSLAPIGAAMSAMHREKLSGLAWYAVDNYPMAFYALDTIASYACPVLPRGATKDQAWNDAAENLFDEWVDVCDWRGVSTFDELMRSACFALDADGDIGVSAERDPATGAMRLRVWPGWRIGTGVGMELAPDEFDGVKVDSQERVVGYRVLIAPQKYRLYPANQFLLLRDSESVDGYRGMSAMRRGLNDIRDAQDTKSFEKLAAKIDSAFAGVIENGAIADSDWADPEGDPAQVSTGTTPRNMTVAELLGGEIPNITGNFKQVGGGRGTAKLEFINQLGGWFVAGLGIPPAFFLDEKLTGPNIRSVIGKAQRKFDRRKKTLAKLAKWVWIRFIADQITRGALTAVDGWQRTRFQTPARISIDLGDQSSSDRDDVAVGNKTRQAYFDEKGASWTDAVDQLVAEDDYIIGKLKEQAKRTGVPLETLLLRHGYPQVPPPVAPPAPGGSPWKPIAKGGGARAEGGGPDVFDHDDVLAKGGGNPDQPRHPKGTTQGGEFAPKNGGGATTPSKAEKAKASHKDNDPVKTAVSARVAELLAAEMGGTATGYNDRGVNHEVDMLSKAVDVEVKGLFSNKNEKLTMHSPEAHDPYGSLNRKKLYVQANNRNIATVAFVAPQLKGLDKKYPEEEWRAMVAKMDGSDFTWFVKEGVGSFRLTGMTKVSGSKEAAKWLKGNKGAIKDAGNALGKAPIVLWGGMNRKEVAGHLAVVAKWTAKINKAHGEEAKAAVKADYHRWTRSVLESRAKQGFVVLSASGKTFRPVRDWNGKPVRNGKWADGD